MDVLNRRQSVFYRAYMHSTLWHFRRWLWFVTSNRRCEDCGAELVLHRYHQDRLYPVGPPRRVLTVHHLTYSRLGRERRSDVALLCWPCHCSREPWKRAR